MKIDRQKTAGKVPAEFGEDILNLRELTGGQKSGILVYDENVIVCNWEGQQGLPHVTFSYDLALIDGSEVELTEVKRLEDIRQALPGTMEYDEETFEPRPRGMKILHDSVHDIPALFGYSSDWGAQADLNEDGSVNPTAGTCYRLEKGGETVLVIAPEGWG